MSHSRIVEPGEQLERNCAFRAGVDDGHQLRGRVIMEARCDPDAACTGFGGPIQFPPPAGIARIQDREHPEERVITARGERSLVGGSGVVAEQRGEVRHPDGPEPMPFGVRT
jgi:hypothetical protein